MSEKFDNQNTDSENGKALATSTARDDAVKTTTSRATQDIAKDRKNLGGLDGEAK